MKFCARSLKLTIRFYSAEGRASWQVAAPETSRCEVRAAVKVFTQSTYNKE